MRLALLILTILVLAAPALGQITQQNILLDVTADDTVYEHVGLRITLNETYDAITYTTAQEPSRVIIDAPYTIDSTGENTEITIHQQLANGTHNLSFTLVFDEKVRRDDGLRSLSMSFEPETDDLAVTLKLPPGYTLADVDAPVVPKPRSISTDGTRTSITWHAATEFDLAVFYQGPQNTVQWTALIGLAVILIGAGALLLRRHARRQTLYTTLGSNEKEVLALVKQGVDKQNALVDETGWSKSKMSKVVRKLEEKGVVTKEPYHKTNRLSVTREWK